MKENFDYVFLTNTPSFYKVNLCRALAKRGLKGLVVFYGFGREAVNVEPDNLPNLFFHFLHTGNSARRSRWATWRALLKLMKSIETSTVIYSGWLATEYNLYSFLSPRRRNVVVVESTPFESTTTGLKSRLKRLIVRRMGRALPSGQLSLELLKRLGFKGRAELTGSVGLIDMPSRPEFSRRYELSQPLRCLYVGRLEEVKNLEWLIMQFAKSGRQLTIVGDGSLRARLEKIATPNITFTGFIPNSQLNDIYLTHDLLVLPSLSEPWGLVVEEALYRGLPVLASDVVGSTPEMINATGAGMTFQLNNADDFESSIARIEQNYATFAEAATQIDFLARATAQINAWQSVISSQQ
ncbi:MAG: glycosyltransferase family 4 protein [Muribaculaceae bacterium]|nr:glycosyltransferase family 4 protein [Muribaculaceae bacterium]